MCLLSNERGDDGLTETCDKCKNAASKETWSLLPVLVLWMIKDRLDFVSNVRLAAVCRNWWSASSCYPKKLQSGLPWIMMQPTSTNDDDGTREFICVSSWEKFRIRLPDLRGEPIALSSEKGWLLVLLRNFIQQLPDSSVFLLNHHPRGNFSGTICQMPDSVFLLNLFTKAKIEMPELESTFVQIAGSFSTCEGNPHCLALIMQVRHHGLTLKVAYPGDNMWTKHYPFPKEVGFWFNGLVVKGTHVYALEPGGRMFVYDMQSWVTKVLLPASSKPDPCYRCYMVELGGEILKVEDRKGSSLLQIFRCNATQGVWEKLNMNEDHIKDTSLFVNNRRGCLPAQEKGLKIYSLVGCESRVSLKTASWWEVRVRDLVDGGSSQMPLPYSFWFSPMWVDVG